ncbi:MAG: ABC transporter substrate-binding protein [Bacteroides sp.]|nr:ABC transporter substrate-binding protein [Bacteroides sp.]
MNIKDNFSLIFSLVLLLLASCKGGNTNDAVSEKGERIPLSYAENLSLTKFPDYVKADIRNPWDTAKTLHTYILIPDSVNTPDNLPAGTVIRTPLKNSLVYSSVHNSLITELGSIDAIKGVCDAQYIHQPTLAKRINSGEVADCGNSMTPNIEKIIKLNPDGILLSPFENSGNYGKLGQLGIPIIECADYMETSPLGRAEWMKFYGILYGREETARDIFNATEKDYLSLKELASVSSVRPTVLVDRLYGSSWNVPAKHSTMGIFIEDAGGINPFSYIDKSGSSPLAGEQVLHKAGDADIWLVRYSQTNDKSLKELASDNPIYPQIKALKDKNVYGCNTSKVFFYEDIPFHPQWLLADLISVFHPELSVSDPNNQRHYFTKIN